MRSCRSRSRYSKASGSTFAIGTTTVYVTFTDSVGHVVVRSFTVKVQDTTAPVITTVSPNLTVEATSPAGATVTYAAATATDVVGPVTITYSKSSGSTFAIGTTTVTVTAKDALRERVHADVHGDGARHDRAGHHHAGAAT